MINWDIEQMKYTGPINMHGHPHGSLGILSVYHKNLLNNKIKCRQYHGSFEHGCFTGDNCRVVESSGTTETLLFQGEFRNYVFIRGKEFLQTKEDTLLFEGSKFYRNKGSFHDQYCNGKLYFNVDCETQYSPPIEYVDGSRKPPVSDP